jgi:hypothetical protein
MPAPRDPIKREIYIKNRRKFLQKLSQDPEWRKNVAEANRKKAQDPEWREKVKEANRKKAQDPEWKRKQKEGALKSSQNPQCRKNHKEGIIKRSQNTKWRESLQGKNNGNWNGGSSFGPYCPLWNKSLKQRIDIFWGGCSTLSGTPPNGEKLMRHHVYYEKKACCIHNDDGTYSIEIDSQVYPIYGQPDKFVLLTRSEHGRINGSFNKVWYMRYFENLINNHFGGKSYLTQDELEALKEITLLN